MHEEHRRTVRRRRPARRRGRPRRRAAAVGHAREDQPVGGPDHRYPHRLPPPPLPSPPTNKGGGVASARGEELVKPAIEKKLGKTVKVEKKESTPPTRIPLLTSNAVDLIAGTMTDTRTRRDSVDFSITFFVTGAQFLVKKGSKIRGIKDIDGKRIAAQQGSTNARIIREKAPKAQLREFPDQPAAFQALLQGQVDAYTNDGIQLAGLKAKAANPAQWDIVGDFFSYEPYGMAMRKNDADFRNVVNGGLMDGIESGKYFEIYDKWFGPKGELPYPMSAGVRTFMLYQAVPK